MASTERRSFGNFGERIACHFLEKRGYTIKERNYLRSWGEIDIVAEKKGKPHFIEVKTNSWDQKELDEAVDKHRPEENVHNAKLKRLARVIQTYSLEHNMENDWQFDVVVVYIDLKNKKSKVSLLEDVVL